MVERTETLIFQPPEEGDDGQGPEVHRVVMGRYRLVRRLGAGGFGVVWEAHDEQLDRLVAVKTIGASNPEVAARAEREAQAAARLTHPGIVALYESAREPDAIHLVSELVFGGTLGELLADGALSDRDILRIGSALCDALAHAHARGVVHRDIKPANVMIPENAESEAAIVKLTDFGVARLAGDETITRNGDIVGTFSYMAPEQAEGVEATAASDLYSLALVLYEALCGVNPVRGETPADTARNVGMELPALSGWRPDLPPELCLAIDRAVAPHPDDRGTVEELRDELEYSLEETPADGTPPPLAFPPVLDAQFGRPRAVRTPVTVPERVLASVAGAVVCGAGVAALPAGAPVDRGSALVAALVAALACGLLPRLGTLLSAVGLGIVFLACGVAGWAVLLAAAFLPGLLLLPREGFLWLAPAGAPLLGLAGVSLAFPAIAGQLSRPSRRAILAGLGFWWLLMAEAAFEPTLLLGDPAGLPARGLWQASVSATVADVLVPVIASGAPLIALVWAGAAWLLPALPVGHRSVADLAFLAIWAAALAAATALAARLLLPLGAGASLRGLVAGAAVAALVALVGVAVRPRE